MGAGYNLEGVENGREGAGTERGKVEKVKQNENSLKREWDRNWKGNWQ